MVSILFSVLFLKFPLRPFKCCSSRWPPLFSFAYQQWCSSRLCAITNPLSIIHQWPSKSHFLSYLLLCWWLHSLSQATHSTTPWRNSRSGNSTPKFWSFSYITLGIESLVAFNATKTQFLHLALDMIFLMTILFYSTTHNSILLLSIFLAFLSHVIFRGKITSILWLNRLLWN